MLEESYIVRFKGFIGALASVSQTLYQEGYIKKKSIDGADDVYYIDEKAAKANERIKRIIDRETLFAEYEIIDEDFDIYEDDDGTDDPYTCYDGNRIQEAASQEVRYNLYNMNPLYLETYICDMLGYFNYSLPYLQNPIDDSKLAAYQYNIDYLKNIYTVSRELMPCLREREIIGINTLERVIYYAWEEFNHFISSINKYIGMFNLNPDNINRKINYNFFSHSDNIISPDKLSLNLRANINIEKLFRILIERGYISPRAGLGNFRNLFDANGNIAQPVIWVKKSTKKQKSKSSLIDFLKLAGISTSKLHDKNLIEKYFQDEEQKSMRLNLFNNKANEKSEYYNELKGIIKEVSSE